MMTTTHDRALGAYLGLAVGDALGATVEFLMPREIQAQYGVHLEIVGGGWLRLKPGAVTDDTEMSLALGRALLASGGWNLKAVADEFAAWLDHFAHQLGEQILGLVGMLDLDAQQRARVLVQRGFPKLLGVHFA